jgi:hypothetical protein
MVRGLMQFSSRGQCDTLVWIFTSFTVANISAINEIIYRRRLVEESGLMEVSSLGGVAEDVAALVIGQDMIWLIVFLIGKFACCSILSHDRADLTHNIPPQI